MIVFSQLPHYTHFAGAFNGEEGVFQISRFSDNEAHITLKTEVEGRECVIIGSIMPPDDQLFALLLLADALKTNGAAGVAVFLPYMAYGRQDKKEPLGGSGIILMGRLLRAAGVDRIVTFDAHSPQDEQYIDMPFTSLAATPIFSDALSHFAGQDGACVVAPDLGAAHRANLLAEKLQLPLVSLTKKHTDGVTHLEAKGSLKPIAIIVDDILATGSTLISAVNAIKKQGATTIYIAVTHGLFIGDKWKELFDMGVQKIITTDTCPQASLQDTPKIEVRTVYPLL